MQDECRISSEANDGGTALEQRCVSEDSSSVSHLVHMRIYACDKPYNFQQMPIRPECRVLRNWFALVASSE